MFAKIDWRTSSNWNFIFFCNPNQFWHIRHVTSKMHWNNCFSSLSNFFFNQIYIQTKSIITIYKYWFCTYFCNSAYCCNKCVCSCWPSSPLPTLSAFNDNLIASVPELTPTAYFVPINFAKFFQTYIIPYLE